MSITAVQHVWKIAASIACLAFAIGPSADAQPLTHHDFAVTRDAEVVADITAGCARCDWAVAGREAVALELSVDGAYSQHLLLTRGERPAEYRVMLGSLAAGRHRLDIARDLGRSARGAGAVAFGSIRVEQYAPDAPEYPWLSRAPILRARPGSVERFSDAPLVMYAERDVAGESGSRYQLQYTVIFTNEDGGTPTDRLMATWGRTTDIEFIYGLTEPGPGAQPHEEIQAAGHKWITFQGPRHGWHPVVWVATDNNMVADHGPDDVITFAPAPQLVSLDRTSREAVMDANPWMYSVTSAEMVREDKVDPAGQPGSGKIPDPRHYATIEACSEVHNATLAFDIGVKRGVAVEWFATDRGEPHFRIARGGCFRGGAPLPAGTRPSDIVGLRVRAYTRPAHEGEAPLAPGTGRVVITRVNRVFMLDRAFVPAVAPMIHWTGSLSVSADAGPVEIPILSR
ncbi:MAG: hypothetical protein ACRD1V_05835 [Vicinamibacterales bacterium]